MLNHLHTFEAPLTLDNTPNNKHSNIMIFLSNLYPWYQINNAAETDILETETIYNDWRICCAMGISANSLTFKPKKINQKSCLPVEELMKK